MKCPSGLRSTPGKCVYKKLYREFESLLHRHILQTQTPDFSRESRGFVVSGVWKRAIWGWNGAGGHLLLLICLCRIPLSVVIQGRGVHDFVECSTSSFWPFSICR